MLFDLLEKIRRKPEGAKKRIAFLSAFSITGLIFVLWLSVWYPAWHYGQIKEQNVVSSEPSPIQTMAETFSSTFSAVSDQIAQLKAGLSGISEEVSNAAYYKASSTPEIIVTHTIMATSTSIFTTSTSTATSTPTHTGTTTPN
jgi:hypothetical protein